MSSVRYDVFFAPLINRCLSSSSADGRLAGSFWQQSDTNSLNALEKLPSSVGASALGIRKSTRIGCSSAYGGSPLAISMAVMPSDQMSAWRPCGRAHVRGAPELRSAACSVGGAPKAAGRGAGAGARTFSL